MRVCLPRRACSEPARLQVWEILAAILHMGNTQASRPRPPRARASRLTGASLASDRRVTGAGAQFAPLEIPGSDEVPPPLPPVLTGHVSSLPPY
jgi:hypothetical protein